jgi:acetylornithine deacetylase/succinyl-diaminopimelate desuccinylase-like protein
VRLGEAESARAADEAVRICSDLIGIDTVNRGSGDCCERPAAEYVAERLATAGLEPRLLESAPGRASVVARIRGSEPQLDALLVHGHLDVVPAQPSDWRIHPFSGEVADGAVWGRGALDMKSMDAMVLAVVRSWARSGRRPRRDIVLAFTADEEDTGAYGAGWLVDHHAGLFEGCTEAIGESGAYTVHARGLRLYPIGAGERGTAWLRLRARGTAGHASRPTPDNAVAHLAAAVARIAAHRWPLRLTPTVLAGIEATAQALQIPGPPDAGVESVMDAMGAAAGLFRPTLRNSATPTMLQAGYKINVVPGEAEGFVDGRTLPGLEEEFAATIDDLTGPYVAWEHLHRAGALAARYDVPIFSAMRAALLAEDPEACVVPYCMSGGTDAKDFARLGISGYGFTPLALPPECDYRSLVHGVDERVPVEALAFGTRVLDAFLSEVG